MMRAVLASLAFTLLVLLCHAPSMAAAAAAANASATTSTAATGDCAQPSRSNYDIKLAEAADLVVSGLAVSALEAGSPVCGPAGDLSVQQGAQEDGSQVVVFWAQCVHYGALVCRRNEADNAAKRCMIAVRIQTAPRKAGQLPPCQVTRGFRYTLLLSSKAAGSCDGVYDMQHPAITDSIRTHVGMQFCAPFPTWPSQDTSVDGDGLASVLGRTCGAAASAEPAQCTGDRDPCSGKAACSPESAVTCVPKACVGRYMILDSLMGVDPCQPVFVSQVTGLPVSGCGVTSLRLARQARQAEKRLAAATSSAAGQEASDADGPQLLPLPSLEAPADSP